MIYLLLLICFAAGAMEQPKKPEQKMLISPQKLLQEAKEEKSYLHMLPSDVMGIVQRHAYNNTLAERIRMIREDYRNNPKMRDKFLYDNDFNQKIVGQLSTEFNRPIYIITLMLNNQMLFGTTFAKKTLSEIFSEYLNQNISYPEVIDYARVYLEGVRFYSEFDRDYIKVRRHIIAEIAQKFAIELTKNNILPEIQIVVDIHSDRVSSWLTDLVSKDFNWWMLTTQFSVPSYASSAEIIAKKNEICNSLTSLLIDALNNNNKEQIIFILSNILSVREPERTIEECLVQKFNGTLGARLINYLSVPGNASEFESKFFPTKMVDALWQYALNTTNAQTILKLLSCIRLTQSWRDSDLSGQPLIQVKNKRNQFLSDLVQSPHADATNVALLILKGADYNQADTQGITLLMHAILRKNIGGIRTLLAQKDTINKNACDKDGHNAFWYVRNLETDAATRLAIIDLLQQAGVTEEATCAIQ